MSLSFFLSAFIELVDRINKVDRAKIQDQQTLFDEIVDPLFQELKPVVNDYMEIFRDARAFVKSTPIADWSRITHRIEKRRNAMLTARISVRKMAERIAEEVKDKEIVAFCNAVSDFFYNASESHRVTKEDYVSQAAGLLDQIKGIIKGGFGKKTLLKDIDRTLALLESNWGEIVQMHQGIKLHSKVSKNLVRSKK